MPNQLRHITASPCFPLNYTFGWNAVGWLVQTLAQFLAVPWLSLRLASLLPPSGARFHKIVRRSIYINAPVSFLLVAGFLTGVWLLVGRLPYGESRTCQAAAVAAGLLIGGWRRRWLCAIVAIGDLGCASLDASDLMAGVGAANLAAWLLLSREQREALAVWSNKPLVIASVEFGSATLLRGRIAILHLFVDTPRRRWRGKTRATAQRRVEQACCWIAECANGYGVKVTFDHVQSDDLVAYFENAIPCLENNYADLDAFESFLNSQLDRFSPTSEFNSLRQSNRCLVVHVAESIGRTAYAVPAYRGRPARRCKIEYAVVGRWSNAAVYAHEILHLFGADDYRREKYDFVAAKTWDDLSERWLRRSIMFDGYLPLEEVVIDELSAQCVGWE